MTWYHKNYNSTKRRNKGIKKQTKTTLQKQKVDIPSMLTYINHDRNRTSGYFPIDIVLNKIINLFSNH